MTPEQKPMQGKSIYTNSPESKMLSNQIDPLNPVCPNCHSPLEEGGNIFPPIVGIAPTAGEDISSIVYLHFKFR